MQNNLNQFDRRSWKELQGRKTPVTFRKLCLIPFPLQVLMASAPCEQNHEDNAQRQLLYNLLTKTRLENGPFHYCLPGHVNTVELACLMPLRTTKDTIVSRWDRRRFSETIWKMKQLFFKRKKSVSPAILEASLHMASILSLIIQEKGNCSSNDCFSRPEVTTGTRSRMIPLSSDKKLS